MISLVVYGHPAPQGSKKYLGRTATGRGIIKETSDNTAPWRADVKAACETFMQSHPEVEPFSCAVSVSMVFTFVRPRTVTRKKRPFPSVYPDLCKIARSTEDAISASGLWTDDALVVEYVRLAKVYAGEDRDALMRPGCRIEIREKPMEPIDLPASMTQVLALEQKAYEWGLPGFVEEAA